MENLTQPANGVSLGSLIVGHHCHCLNNGKALRNITDGNPLHQNDNECHHQLDILVKVVNDAAP